MRWMLFQSLIVFAVCSMGIYYEWTPNGYALSFVAGCTAAAATWLLGKCIDLWRYGRSLRVRQQSRYDGGGSRVHAGEIDRRLVGKPRLDRL